jgi:hypothetical protein
VADDVDTLVAELQEIVDLSATAALTRLNRRHRQMVVRAQNYKGHIEVLTVADTATYSVLDPQNRPPIEVLAVTVEGAQYERGQFSDPYQYAQGLLVFDGPGLYVPDSITGTRFVTLVPTPSTSGVELDLFCALEPPDLVAGGAVSTIKVDVDLLDALVEGAAATELARIGEGDPASLEAKFSAACEELRSRERRRPRGAGPVQIRIKGVNA